MLGLNLLNLSEKEPMWLTSVIKGVYHHALSLIINSTNGDGYALICIGLSDCQQYCGETDEKIFMILTR